MHASTLIQLCALATVVFAHSDKPMGRDEFNARRALADARHLKARACSSQVSEFAGRRKAKRGLALKKRSNEKRCESHSESSTYPHPTMSFTETAPVPHHTAIKDLPGSTCVASPEIHEGPYFVNNELVRWNLTEDQIGVPLIMDFGVIDISTCEPMQDIFVEVWAANATGIYSAYPAAIPNNITVSSSASNPASTSFTITPFPDPTSSLMSSAVANTTTSAFVRPPMQRNETFLRGGMPTNEDGIVELHTIYPGYYTNRAPHMHAVFHHDWKMSPNGTVISRSGTNLHTGQFFFAEEINDAVYSLPLYQNWDYLRVLNVNDRLLNMLAEADRSSAFFDLEMIGDTVEDGFYAYITVLLDPTRVVPLINNFYFNSTGYTPPV
ncbi:Intradiol ring-cleavage dioxygenase [Pterulicium gracile]|uniref:Intradiol ring-cleavage dioxygenase n=1 Tax=Pterulicium gracile TaxID=1884261 RepID=A0A5C3QR37_9AGAR|nr:Intradiol ring-cleavage dioxygenase [Pterula gracilis]